MVDYLIKSSACLAVFMLFYKLFLEKESMHVFKRFYLLISLLISIGIPFITFTQFIEVPVKPNDFIISNSTNPTTIQEESINNFPLILWSIYVLGVVVFSLKFIFNLSKILKKIKQNPKLKTQKSIHVLLEA
ncbi:MAG TPA: peptidase M56, partial [Xanthomarina gelatinilytica]|nr:peptidase M56 [Xanthomarina gelatinilytica]